MRNVFPELSLYVVSEFPPAGENVRWVRCHGGFFENLARCRAAFREISIRLAGVLLVPNVPFPRMRLLALVLAPFYFLAVNEHPNNFMLRPASLPAIARRHQYFLDFHRPQVSLDLAQPGIEVKGFVADVRPACARAQLAIAPLVVSAGTNLKVLEAMACGCPVISTPASVNRLELTPGTDFILAHTGAEMAEAIERLLQSPEECQRIAPAAGRQDELYRELARI